MENSQYVVCRLCGQQKPHTEYYTRKDTGLKRSECKECLKMRATFRATGWTQAAYERAFLKQQGRCAICHSTLNSSRYTKLAGDHCHTSGKLRGLLCTNCNTGLGLFKDSPERLESAIQYLRHHTQR